MAVPPTPDDLEALAIIEAAERDRVKTIRTRAEKWLPGLTALVALVSTALVVKGAESFSKITGSIELFGYTIDAKALTAWLIAATYVLLLIATVAAYTAAFGSALSPNTIDPEGPDPGARLANWRITAERKARFRLKSAVVLTLAGSILLAVAIGVATFAPTEPDGDTSLCLFVGDEQVLKAPSPLQVEAIAGGEVRPC